ALPTHLAHGIALLVDNDDAMTLRVQDHEPAVRRDADAVTVKTAERGCAFVRITDDLHALERPRERHVAAARCDDLDARGVRALDGRCTGTPVTGAGREHDRSDYRECMSHTSNVGGVNGP